MMFLSGHHHKEIQYDTLTDVCTEFVSSESGGGLEAISAGPPFSSFRVRSDARWTGWRMVWAAILMSWSVCRTLGDRFEDVWDCLVKMFPWYRRPGKTYQGLIAALGRWSSGLLECVGRALRRTMQEIAGAYWKRQGLLAFAVDGSRVECPRTKGNEEALGCGGRKKTGPQFWLTTLWHMGMGLPWAWKIGPSTDAERTHLREMLPMLPPGATLVADAGFVGYALLRDILRSGRSFLIRVGSNVSLLQELGYAEVEHGQTVYLWPQEAQKGNASPLVLRLIVLGRRGKRIYLVTNLLPETMADGQASVLYEMRWGVEVFYRSMKQTQGHRRMLSGAAGQAEMELDWTMVGLQLLGLLSVEQIIGRGKDPLSWSVALSLRTIRLAMRDRKPRGARSGGLLNCLGAAVKDEYVRHGSKKARNWPHKKNDPPAGAPKIRKANRTEVQKAARIKTTKLAA
jgi:hypothetical protein